jgi:hypothetical protein
MRKTLTKLDAIHELNFLIIMFLTLHNPSATCLNFYASIAVTCLAFCFSGLLGPGHETLCRNGQESEMQSKQIHGPVFAFF